MPEAAIPDMVPDEISDKNELILLSFYQESGEDYAFRKGMTL